MISMRLSEQARFQTSPGAGIRRIAVAMFMLLGMFRAVAQTPDTTLVDERPSLYMGVYGGLSLVNYDVFLRPSALNNRVELPATASFREGDGVGALAGLLVELPMSATFNLGLRAGYQLHEGSMSQDYINPTDVAGPNGLTVPATVRGTVDTKFGYVSLTPYVRVEPFFFPLYFYGGPTILLPAQAQYTYDESIVDPGTNRFKDPGPRGARTTRNLGSRGFDNATMVLAVSAGAGYEFKLSPEFGVFLEAQFQPTLGDLLEPLLSGEKWTASTVSGVFGFRYGFNSAPSPAPRPPVIASRDTIVSPRTELFDAKGITPGGLSDTIRIAPRSVKSTEVHALLPYVFFDHDSAMIPDRYVRMDAKARRDFRVERLPRGSTLGLYYNLLNIVGARVRDDRVKEVVVTGCMSQFESDSTLPQRRAEAVRDYLVNVWRVPAARVKVRTRILPANPSLSEVDERTAALENQRVEIFSEGYIVERPVELPDTTFLEPVGVVRFLPPPTDSTGAIDSWALDVMIGDSLIRRAVTGVGMPPAQIDFEIENRPDLDLRGQMNVSSTLVIRDTLYQELSRQKSREVVVRGEGDFTEERTMEGGRFVDTYNLLLYSFDSSDATAFTWQAANLIKRRIGPNSTVRIIGHTDNIGLPSYNQALSQRRAEFAAQLMNIQPAELVGRGERQLLYDNSHPEGRYYCRTVTVIVETPIEGQSNVVPSTPREEGRN